jgi:hypothetical protein
VDLTKVQQIDTLTVLGNDTGGTANVKAMTATETKTLLALNNVDNTSDLNKPISSNTQTALDAKVTGPASAVANRVATFDGTTGKLIKDSGFTIETSVPSGALFTDTGEVNIIEEVQAEGVALSITSKAVNVTRASLGLDTIGGLDDVVITTPLDEQLLVYDDATGKWVNQTVATGGAATEYNPLIETTDWTELTTGDFANNYVAEIEVIGLEVGDNPFVDLDLSDDDTATQAKAVIAQFNKVFAWQVTDADELTLYASDDITEDIKLHITVVK